MRSDYRPTNFSARTTDVCGISSHHFWLLKIFRQSLNSNKTLLVVSMLVGPTIKSISQSISVICSRQMPDFSAKMHQIQLQRISYRSLQCSQTPSWWGGSWLPTPQEPHPLLALRTSIQPPPQTPLPQPLNLKVKLRLWLHCTEQHYDKGRLLTVNVSAFYASVIMLQYQKNRHVDACCFYVFITFCLQCVVGRAQLKLSPALFDCKRAALSH